MRLSLVATAVSLSLVGLAAAQNARAAIRKSTEIPAQQLELALQALAKDREFQVIYRSEIVSRRESGGATGELTQGEALDQLLDRTGLTYQYLDDHTITILPLAEARVAAAPAYAKGAARSSASSAAQVADAEKGAQKKSFWDRFRLAQVDRGNDSSDVSVGGENKNDSSRQNGEARPSRIEEVIVTATKRAENIRDVPLSMAVVSADEIARRGLVSAEDYLRGIPGVNQTDGNVGPSVVIRGLETTTAFQNFASGSTVALYFGETPTTNSAGITGGSGADIKLVDIERVEVLRGPQGTAFGNSSLGGVVRTIPVEPKRDRFEAKLGAGYSVTSGTGGGNHAFHAIGNAPLVQDKLAIRATAYRFEDSGFYLNTAGSDPALQAAAATYGALAYATDVEEVGTATFNGGRVAALFQPGEDLKLTLTYLTQKTEIGGWIGSNREGYRQAILRVGPEEVVLGQEQGGNETNIDLVNAVLDYDLGWGNLLATYSHIDGSSAWSFPFSARPQGVLQLPMVTPSLGDHSEHSGEIRLATRFDGAWNFLAGLYAENLEDEWRQTVYWYGDPARSTLPVSAAGVVADFRDRSELDHKAAFGEVSWEFLPELTLTGGVRYYDYDRASASAAPVVSTGKSNDSGANVRGNLSYKLNDDTLLYAGWAQGFRLGKPQPGLPPAFCDRNGDGIIDGTNKSIAATRELHSDSVDSYEIGGKVALLDRRLTLDGAVFRIDWSDMPAQVAQQCGVSSIGYTANAGRATSEGIEAQAGFLVTESLRVDAGASWIDARLAEDVPLQGFAAGDRLPSPRVNANLSMEYAFEIGSHKAYIRADSIYVGRFHSAMLKTAANEAGDYVKLDTSMRVLVKDLTIDLFVRNVANADDITYVLPGNTSFRQRPRTIGVQLGYDF